MHRAAVGRDVAARARVDGRVAGRGTIASVRGSRRIATRREERPNMPEVSEYAPGTPSWVDLASPDPDASARFYGGLFGWDAPEGGPVEETGGYRMFRREGKNVAGVGPTQGEGPPAPWATDGGTREAEAGAGRGPRGGGRGGVWALARVRAGGA